MSLTPQVPDIGMRIQGDSMISPMGPVRQQASDHQCPVEPPVVAATASGAAGGTLAYPHGSRRLQRTVGLRTQRGTL